MKKELLNKIEEVLAVECTNDISNDFIEETRADDSRYFCDAFPEYADGRVDIYYYDIKQFIINNIELVEEALDEFGWDGCGKDLHKAGQMAQFLQNERQLQEDFEPIKNRIALDYLEEVLTNEQAEALNKREDLTDLINELESDLSIIDECASISDIAVACDKFIESLSEEE